MKDPYCYPNGVLRNKLGITEQGELDKAEVDFSCLALHELAMNPLEGNYDFAHYCAFHERVFCDVYEWAGQPRIISTEKAEKALGTLSVEYAQPENIATEAEEILSRMNGREWNKMPLDEQTKTLSKDMADLWKVHAFREGNTRTTVSFVCQFAESRGVAIEAKLFAKNSEYMRKALVVASARYSDVDLSDSSYLERIVKDGLERGRNREQAKEKPKAAKRKADIDRE